MPTLENTPQMLWKLLCCALLCQTACTNTLKMGMHTTEPAGQEQHEDPQEEQLVAELSALDLNATTAAQHQDPQTATSTLNISDELINSLQPKTKIEVLDSCMSVHVQPNYAKHDLTTLQEALRRVRDGHQAIHDPIELKAPIMGGDSRREQSHSVSLLAACMIVPKAPPRELFEAILEAMIKAGAKTHGPEADVCGIPLFLVAIHADLLSVARRLLENGALVDINRVNPINTIRRVLYNTSSVNEQEKQAFIHWLVDNGLDVNNAIDDCGDTLLHKLWVCYPPLPVLLNRLETKESLYRSNDWGLTAWQAQVEEVAAGCLGADDCQTRYLDDAQTLILAMDPEEIMHKKTIDKAGNKGPTHLEEFNELLTADIAPHIKQKITEAFVLKKLTPWVIKKKTGITIDCNQFRWSSPWEERGPTLQRLDDEEDGDPPFKSCWDDS